GARTYLRRKPPTATGRLNQKKRRNTGKRNWLEMTKEDRDRAAARSNKITRAAQDARSGKTDRDAASKAVLDNMARLKALRLAREAAEPPAAPVTKKASARKKS